LVSFDEEWENLEYARVQVRIPISSNARLSKPFRINSLIFPITIEEEAMGQGGCSCKCLFNNFLSSDSVSSKDSFVEETIILAGASVDEVGSGGEALWREETQNQNRQLSCSKTRNGGFTEECMSTHGKGVQKKGQVHCMNKEEFADPKWQNRWQR